MSKNASVELTPAQMDALYAVVSRDITDTELETLTGLAQKVAYADPRGKSDTRHYVYSTGPSVV